MEPDKVALAYDPPRAGGSRSGRGVGGAARPRSGWRRRAQHRRLDGLALPEVEPRVGAAVALLREQEGARRFLAGDVAGELAARGVEATVPAPEAEKRRAG